MIGTSSPSHLKTSKLDTAKMRAGNLDWENNPDDSKYGCNINCYSCDVSCGNVSAVVQYTSQSYEYELATYTGWLTTDTSC